MPPIHDPKRRELLTGLLAGAAVLTLPGCGSCPEGDHDGVTQPGPTGDTSPAEPTGETAAPTEPTDTDAVPWLTGGTAALAADYDIDWDDADECAQTCQMILGPCHQSAAERQDISEAREGLPTRMAFRVLDTGCKPLVGAVVDVWHCDAHGVYSGANVARMCHGGDEAAVVSAWFRGWGTTDEDGVVAFDTCMPGWYPGRAVHIHLQVIVNGDNFVVSQLGFDEALVEDVYDSHPDYVARGQADTTNQMDDLGNPDLGDPLFSWRKADDGALVLWKTLVVRQVLDEPTC